MNLCCDLIRLSAVLSDIDVWCQLKVQYKDFARFFLISHQLYPNNKELEILALAIYNFDQVNPD